MRGIYSLLRGNIQFLFQFLQRRDEAGLPFLGSFVIELRQQIVGLLFAPGAFGQLVAGEARDVGRRIGGLRGLQKCPGRAAMILQFVPQ